MKFQLYQLTTLLACVAALGIMGCSGNPPATPAGEAEHHAGDGHEHGEKEHGHGGEHGHPEEGPHHGHLIELGNEEYHAELTHDDATKTVMLYLLGKDAATAVAIADAELMLNLVADGKPLQAKLAAAPQENDPAGQSSRFTVVDETVLEAIEAPTTTVRLNVTIADKPYSGKLEHHEHGAHEH